MMNGPAGPELSWNTTLDRIKRMLGYPVVSVYTPDESILQMMDDAFIQFSSEVFNTETFAVPPQERIQLPKEQVAFIYNVAPYGAAPGCNFVYQRGEFTLTEAIAFWNFQNMNLLQPLLASSNYNSLMNVMGRKFDWSYDRNTGMLLTMAIPDGTQVLAVKGKVVYTKDSLTREAMQWIYRMALAMTKISEGRIRSKYTEGTIGIVSDGATLLAEGQEEYNKQIEALESFQNLAYGVRR